MPFADGRYPTPSGKIELYSEQMLRQGLDPVVDYTPEAESRDGAPELAARYPIQLVSPAAHHFLNTSFADMPTMRKKQRRPTLELQPVDAAARGIADGDLGARLQRPGRSLVRGRGEGQRGRRAWPAT